MVSHRGRGRGQRVLLSALGWQRCDTGAGQEAPRAPCGPMARGSMAFGNTVAYFNGHGIENQPRPLVIQASEP